MVEKLKGWCWSLILPETILRPCTVVINVAEKKQAHSQLPARYFVDVTSANTFL
jgi:hypothetical protein